MIRIVKNQAKDTVFYILKTYIETTTRREVNIPYLIDFLKRKNKNTSSAYISQLLSKFAKEQLIKKTIRSTENGYKIFVVVNSSKNNSIKIKKQKDIISSNDSIIKSISDLQKKVREQKMIISNLIIAIDHKDKTLNEIKRMLNKNG